MLQGFFLNPLPLALNDSRSVRAVKGSLARSAAVFRKSFIFSELSTGSSLLLLVLYYLFFNYLYGYCVRYKHLVSRYCVRYKKWVFEVLR